MANQFPGQQAGRASAVGNGQAPAAVGPAIAGQTPTAPSTDGLSGLTYRQLKARYDELQTQRQILADRRASVADRYESATGASKAGIGDRLAVMDKSMVLIETQLGDVAQQLVLKAPGTPSYAPRGPSIDGFTTSEVFGTAMTVCMATFIVTMFITRRISWRRWRREFGPSNQTNSVAGNERLDRIEQAVDTIAVEIERVSENQRFMTRLMTETQLGASIAAVRSSTDMAKSAAESG